MLKMDRVAMTEGTQKPAELASSFLPIPTQSWYPPSVLGASASDYTQTSGGTANPLSMDSPGTQCDHRPHSPDTYTRQALSSVSRGVPALNGKSTEELRELLMNKDIYHTFLLSIDQVRQYDTLQNELKMRNVDLARHNLEKEAEITELRNQCMIIQNTQLAASQERFAEVAEQEKQINSRFSFACLMQKLEDSMTQVDENSERLNQQLVEGKMELADFVRNYHKQRLLYHRRAIVRLAAVTSFTPVE